MKKKYEFSFSLLARVGTLKTIAETDRIAISKAKKFLIRRAPLPIYGVEPMLDLRISDIEVKKRVRNEEEK